jgi:hypothetical protein
MAAGTASGARHGDGDRDPGGSPGRRLPAPDRHRGGRARRGLLPRAPAHQRAGPGTGRGGADGPTGNDGRAAGGARPGRVRHDQGDVRGRPGRSPYARHSAAPADADRAGTRQWREAHRLASPQTARHQRIRLAARRGAASRPARSRLGSAARGDHAGTDRPGAPADQTGALSAAPDAGYGELPPGSVAADHRGRAYGHHRACRRDGRSRRPVACGRH